MNNHIKDLTGQKFGRLLVTEFLGVVCKKAVWRCLCDCGKERILRANALVSGNTLSCGCYNKVRLKEVHTRHGHNCPGSRSKTYQVWDNMIQRCSNLVNKNYKNYDGRGITVCKRWEVFEHFLEDRGETIPGLTIDRIDNEKGYFPENCRHTTPLENQMIRRNTVRLPFEGKDYTLKELARKFFVSYRWVYRRYYAGITGAQIAALPKKELVTHGYPIFPETEK